MKCLLGELVMKVEKILWNVDNKKNADFTDEDPSELIWIDKKKSESKGVMILTNDSLTFL